MSDKKSERLVIYARISQENKKWLDEKADKDDHSFSVCLDRILTKARSISAVNRANASKAKHS